MTKAELIEEVSRVVEMTRKDSEVIVEAIFDSIVRSLRGGVAHRAAIPGSLGGGRSGGGHLSWPADVCGKSVSAIPERSAAHL